MTAAAHEEARLLALVCAEVADVVGLDRPTDVDPDGPFADLGFESMSMIELSVALARATGLELPATLGFDYPTPVALAGYLARTLGGESEQAAQPRGECDDPIVIVGIGCRFPGGVRSPEDLFALVARGTDAVTPFPTDRGWALDELFDPDPARARTTYVREGGFVDDVMAFDAGFFGIGPREATAMDPQHRLLLETAWETLEHARVDPMTLRGTAAGVFVGLATNDYYGARAATVPEDLERHFVLANAGSVASGRIAYTLGLEGPAVTIDTACSSSLVALHLAASSLRQGECALALAGGVCVYTTPETFVTFSRQRSLSSDGRCRAYGRAADGTGFAEGVGLVLLERRSDARRLGHRELAVVRGSAINQDGASNGITAPNGPSQERVIKRALLNAGLAPKDVDIVEGHGTGTTLGDPIEAQAVLATYGRDRPPERPLRLGSLKSNIAHAQAAAGIGGIIKIVMALRHGLMPKTLYADEPTPHVDWSSSAVELLVESREWPRGDRPRRGAVSAFGISGTNAHVILEEPAAPAQAPADEPGPAAISGDAAVPTAPAVMPLVVSARSPEALGAQAARLRDHLEQRPALRLLDVAHSLVATRAAHEHRAVVLGGARGDLLAGLEAIAADAQASNVVYGRARRREPIAFVFAGQGTHWTGMARELRAASPVFADSLEVAATAVATHVDWSPLAVLAGEPGAPSMDLAEVVQPTLFVVMVSLAALWRSFGVQPAVVIGHSQGEVAAAHVGGALTLDDAACLAVRRSHALGRLQGCGGLLSLAAPVEEVSQRLAHWNDRLCVAAINSPTSVVVSGDDEALRDLLAQVESEGMWARLLQAGVPAHSPLVDGLRERLLADLAQIVPAASDVGFASTVTGAMHDTAALGAEYWYRNLRQPVRFADAVSAAAAQGCRTFVEVSPHPVLTYGLDATLEAAGIDLADVTIVDSLDRDDGGLGRFATSAAKLHTRGQSINWSALLGGRGARSVDLPTYAFDRSRFWMGPAPGQAAGPAASGLRPTGHPLLSSEVALAGREELLFTGRVSIGADAWLADHAVLDSVLLPGTAFVELALRAAREAGCDGVDELTIEAPLVLARDGAAQLQLSVGEPDDGGRRTVSIASRLEGPGAKDRAWTHHATGTLAAAGSSRDAELAAAGAVNAWPPAGDEIDIEELYARLRAQGLDYGPVFQGLRAAWRTGDVVFADLCLDADSAAGGGGFEVHPALFDAAFHAIGERLLLADPGQVWLPFSWRGVRLYQRGATALRARLTTVRNDGVRLIASDESGAPVVTVDSVVVRKVTAAQLAGATARQESLWTVDWLPSSAPTAVAVRVAVLGDRVTGLEAEPCRDVAALAAAVAGAGPAVALVAVSPGDPAGDLAAQARDATSRALELLQTWLGDDRCGDARLALLTHAAIATAPGEAPDSVGAAVWGLARSAQAEHPDRVVLVDVDGAAASSAALATGLSSGEPELAIRDGRLLGPRLVRASTPDGAARDLDPDGTVLITGGTTGIGKKIARHLVVAHGVRHLLLASRRGASAPHVAELRADLGALGAQVSVAACDVADRAALVALLAQIPGAHPLTGVVHSAGSLDDGVIDSLTPDRLERVMRPKVDAAMHLHGLTEHLKLAMFAVFSSIAGTFGSAAQGNYAAANAFLDALAQRRHASGLAGTSIAWGLWAETTDIISHLDERDRARLARLGLAPLSSEAGCALFDAALDLGRPLVVAARLDVPALRALAKAGAVSPALRALAGAGARAPTQRRRWRLASVPEAERLTSALDLVRSHCAAILGHDVPAAIEPQRAFKELGFDSIGAVELRNRLVSATGLRLSSTVVFDQPSPGALAAHLLTLVHDGASARSPVDEQLDRLEVLIDSVDGDERDAAAARVRGLLAMLAPAPPLEGVDVADSLRTASVEELVDFIDRDLQGS